MPQRICVGDTALGQIQLFQIDELVFVGKERYELLEARANPL